MGQKCLLYIGPSLGKFSWKLGLIGLLLVFTYILHPFLYLFIYLLIYLFVYLFIFPSHLFSFLFWTFILSFHNFHYLLAQSILYYILRIHFIVSYVPNLLLLVLQHHDISNIYVFTSYKLIVFPIFPITSSTDLIFYSNLRRHNKNKAFLLVLCEICHFQSHKYAAISAGSNFNDLFVFNLGTNFNKHNFAVLNI